MELNGEVELDGVSPGDAWLVCSDPVTMEEAIPGCEFMAPAREAGTIDTAGQGTGDSIASTAPEDRAARTFEEGDEYVAVIRAGTGSIKPRFESEIRITECEFPRMSAHVDGAGGDSAFSMATDVEFVETNTGVTIGWHSEVDISGRLAQMDTSVLTLVSETLVDRFFDQLEQDLAGTRA